MRSTTLKHRKAEHPMETIRTVQRIVEAILAENLEPALELIAADAAFTLAIPGRRIEERGRQAVADYFETLGGIVTFWRVRYFAEGEQVLVLGNECFTMNRGVEVESAFALLFTLRDSVVSELLVIEELSAGTVHLPSWPQHGPQEGPLLTAV
jgi:hypothetical protein